MIQMLVRHFIPNWENVKDPMVRQKYGTLAASVGILSNLFLFIIKIIAGLLSFSVAIIADAVNNLSDAGSSIITLVAFKMASRPADSRHPYGHARIEYISGMAVSIIIIVLGLQLLGSSFQKILHPESVSISALTYVILVISILVKLWQGMFNRRLSKQISSEALAATAADSLNDVIATSVVLLSAIIFDITSIPLDGWMGLLVSIFITVSGIKLVIETADLLIGKAPDADLIQELKSHILSHDGIIGMHDLQVHSYGPACIFASVHAEVPAEGDILTSHDLIDNIEREVLNEMGIQLVIHMDPVITGDERLDKLKAQVSDIITGINPKIQMHDFRAVFGSTHTNLVFDIVVPPDDCTPDEEICHQIEAEAKKLGNYFCVITVDHYYIYTEYTEK